MKTYNYSAEMGSIMLESCGVRFFFYNDIGDGDYEVSISETNQFKEPEYTFIGHFEVMSGGEAILHDYDCGGIPLHTFKTGRYPVYRDGKGNMYIGKWPF